MKTIYKILIICLIFSILIGAEIIILNHEQRKLNEEWSKHIENGETYVGDGLWVPTKFNQINYKT